MIKEIPQELIDKINKEYEDPDEPQAEVLDPDETMKKLQDIEAKLSMVNEFPELIQQVISKYDETVTERFNVVLKRTGSGGGSQNLLGTVTEIIKNVTSSGADNTNQEVNSFANKIVVMSLRNTMRNMEKNIARDMGVPYHQGVELHESSD